MKFLSICRICEQFPPAKGGLAGGIHAMTQAQHEMGNEITVIAPYHPGSESFDCRQKFPIIRVPAKRTFDFGIKAFNEYRKLRNQIDIVHTHGPSAILWATLKRKTKPFLVHTVHSVRRYQYLQYDRYLSVRNSTEQSVSNSYKCWNPYIAKELFLEQFVLKRVDHLCLVADYFKEQLAIHYGIKPEKTTTVLNGSAFNFDVSIVDRDRNALKGAVVLFVGRFDWHKRIDLLIRAHSLVIQKKPHCQLILVGDGEQRSVIEALIEKLRLQKNVMLTGWIEASELNDYYQIANCLCLPSIVEGLPKVLLEAMSVGVSIIASDNLAHTELLRNGKFGCLVNSAMPEKWAEAILDTISEPPVVRLRIKASMNLLDNLYRWHHVAQRTQNAYEKLFA